MIAKAQNTTFKKVRVLQRKLYLAAKADPKRKFGVLYDKLCSKRVLGMEWTQVRANKDAPGIDRFSIEEIEKEIGVGNLLRHIQTKLVAKR